MSAVKEYRYKVVVHAEGVAPFNVILDIPTEDEAKAMMASLAEKVAVRDERFVTFGRVMVDRTKVVAYQVVRYPLMEDR